MRSVAFAISPWRVHEVLRSLGGHWNAIYVCWPYPAGEART